MRIPRIDAISFWEGFGLGAAIGALGCIVFELWIHRIETGEIEPPEGYSEELKRETTILEEDSRERVTLNRQFEKPALDELVRNADGEPVTDYTKFAGSYSSEETEHREIDSFREETGETAEVVTEESDVVEDRVFVEHTSNDRELTPVERVQMNRRFRVISQDSYENERPYNDKYQCTYFTRDHILAGFDGDLMPVADNLLWGVAHEGISVKGASQLFIRDTEGDSDFHVMTDDRTFDEVYEEWYGTTKLHNDWKGPGGDDEDLE